MVVLFIRGGEKKEKKKKEEKRKESIGWGGGRDVRDALDVH